MRIVTGAIRPDQVLGGDSRFLVARASGLEPLLAPVAGLAQIPGRDRHVHLVLENHDNTAHFLRQEAGRGPGHDAQWNDDVHHAFHVLLTGETDGYYEDYADAPARHLARCLAEEGGAYGIRVNSVLPDAVISGSSR